jgi:hypothetical protein
MNLNVEIITQSKNEVLTLPREAVVSEASARYVYRVANETLERRTVQTGILNPTRAEIVEVLEEGVEVALAGDVILQDGMRVRVENE